MPSSQLSITVERKALDDKQFHFRYSNPQSTTYLNARFGIKCSSLCSFLPFAQPVGSRSTSWSGESAFSSLCPFLPFAKPVGSKPASWTGAIIRCVAPNFRLSAPLSSAGWPSQWSPGHTEQTKRHNRRQNPSEGDRKRVSASPASGPMSASSLVEPTSNVVQSLVRFANLDLGPNHLL
jgi:hypothetical protein